MQLILLSFDVCFPNVSLIKFYFYSVQNEHQQILETNNKEEIKEKGLYYSKLWNIVESEEWANLNPERGDGGPIVKSAESIERIRKYQKNKKWTDKAIATRMANCLKASNARKGSKWTAEHRKSRMDTYVSKNLELANKIYELADAGYNKLAIAKMLKVSWEKVHYPLVNRAEFEIRKETQNYQKT